MALRVRVCELGDVVEGELRGFAVPGVTWPVMVTIAGGDLYAFPGVCPHADVSLADYGVLADAAAPGAAEVVCRVHGYRFALATGRCEHNPRLHLRRYPVTLIDHTIWVDLL